MTDDNRALTGLKVIEAGGMVSAAYAAKLLADLGADVVKVELPAGDPARRRGPYPRGREHDPEASGLFIYLNANKRGVTLDLRQRADHDRFLRLLDGADILIHNFTRDEADDLHVAYEALHERCPRLVYTWITPFGLDGPHARWAADELTIVAAGGWTNLSPGTEPDPHLPPLKAFGRQGDFQAGVAAAIATMGALYAREQSGGGQRVVVSAQEVIASALELSLVYYTYHGTISNRFTRPVGGAMGLMRCRDGYIYAIAVEDHHWQALMQMMGQPEWAQWGVAQDRVARLENADVLGPLIRDWMLRQSAEDIIERAVAARLPFAPVSTARDLLHSPHLKARGYFETIHQPGVGAITVPGSPYRLPDTPWKLRRPAPRLGEHTEEVLGAIAEPPHARPGPRHAPAPRAPAGSRTLPLAGVRVVDLSWVWAGPYAGMQLAHLGAEVIRVESEGRPCITRRVNPFADGVEGLNRSGDFNEYNQGKLSVQLNLKRPEAVAIVRELAAVSDIVVENFAVGVLDRLGLGWPALAKGNPQLIMVSMSGYGREGPFRERLAYGTPIVHFSGLAAFTGYVDGDPKDVGLSFGDPNQGLHAAYVVLAALWARRRTGRGQYIDFAQAEGMISVLPEGILPYSMRGEEIRRSGNRDLHMAPHGIYPCRGEDRWVTIAIRDDGEWQRFAALIGPDVAADERFGTQADRKRNEDALDALVGAWTAPQDRWAVAESLQAAALAAFPVMDTKDLAEDPHLNERGYFVALEHPEIGRRKHGGIPWRFSETPVTVRRPAPCIGQDNDYVLQTLLGRSAAEQQRLVDAGIVS